MVRRTSLKIYFPEKWKSDNEIREICDNKKHYINVGFL